MSMGVLHVKSMAKSYETYGLLTGQIITTKPH